MNNTDRIKHFPSWFEVLQHNPTLQALGFEWFEPPQWKEFCYYENSATADSHLDQFPDIIWQIGQIPISTYKVVYFYFDEQKQTLRFTLANLFGLQFTISPDAKKLAEMVQTFKQCHAKIPSYENKAEIVKILQQSAADFQEDDLFYVPLDPIQIENLHDEFSQCIEVVIGIAPKTEIEKFEQMIKDIGMIEEYYSSDMNSEYPHIAQYFTAFSGSLITLYRFDPYFPEGNYLYYLDIRYISTEQINWVRLSDYHYVFSYVPAENRSKNLLYVNVEEEKGEFFDRLPNDLPIDVIDFLYTQRFPMLYLVNDLYATLQGKPVLALDPFAAFTYFEWLADDVSYEDYFLPLIDKNYTRKNQQYDLVENATLPKEVQQGIATIAQLRGQTKVYEAFKDSLEKTSEPEN